MSATEESSCNDSPLVDLRLPAPSALIITEISSSSYSSSSEEFSEPNDIENIQEHSRDNNLHQVTKKKTAPCSRTLRTNNPVASLFSLSDIRHSEIAKNAEWKEGSIFL